MMTTKSLCWLCVNICTGCRNLYDENGHQNETYEITVKYFDPIIFNHEGQGHHLIVMCLDCWRRISDFHKFRESVLLAQTKLLDVDKVETVMSEVADNNNFDIVVKKEEEEFIALMRTDLDARTTTNPSTARSTHDRVINSKGNLTVLDGNPAVISPGRDGDVIPSQVGSIDASAVTITNDNVCVPQTCGISVVKFSPPHTSIVDRVINTESYLPVLDGNPAVISPGRDVDVIPAQVGSIDASAVSADTITNDNVCVPQTCGISVVKFSHQQNSIVDGVINTESYLPVLDGNPAVISPGRDVDVIPAQVESIDASVDTITNDNVCVPQTCGISVVKFSPPQNSIVDRVINTESYLPVLDGNPAVISPGRDVDIIPSQVGSIDASAVSADTITNDNVCVPQTSGGISVVTFSPQQNSINPPKDLNTSTSSEQNSIDVELSSDVEYVGNIESPDGKHRSNVSNSPGHRPSMFKRRYHLVGHTLKSTEFTHEIGKIRTATESDTFIAKWLPGLKCEKCQESCSSYSLLRMHHLKQHPNESFYIVCCTIKFYGRCAVEEHIRSRHTENPTCCKCGLCGKYFKTTYYLQRHIYETHKKSSALSTIKCGICNASRTTFAAYQNHFRIKHPDEEFYVICGQRKFCGRIKQSHEQRHTP